MDHITLRRSLSNNIRSYAGIKYAESELRERQYQMIGLFVAIQCLQYLFFVG